MQRSKSLKNKSKEPVRSLTKRDCQLQEFPTIKLHILHQIQFLDLAHNNIANFSSLTTHSKTSQHVLKHLRELNIAHNQVESVSCLKPLASTACNLQIINVEGNPLTRCLNYLFEIVAIFPQIKMIIGDETAEIDQGLRVGMAESHIQGGKVMESFLQGLKIKNADLNRVNVRELASEIQNIIEFLEEQQKQIMTLNQNIFKAVSHFLAARRSNKPEQTYRSPTIDKRTQIEVLTTYEIESPNMIGQLQCQNEPELNIFYLNTLAKSTTICQKLLQQLEVDEATNTCFESGEFTTFKPDQLLFELKDKWHQQAELIKHNYIVHQKSISPLKSIFTADGTDRDSGPSSPTIQKDRIQCCYFGLDKEWSLETTKFIKHRLLNFLKILIECGDWQQQSDVDSLDSLSEEKGMPRYLQECLFDKAPDEFIVRNKVEQIYQSPKSQNKFIMASCIRMLEQTVKRIVFRKITCVRRIKLSQLLYLQSAVMKVEQNLKRIALRNIFEDALFMCFIIEKLYSSKIKRMFLAWKQVRIRRLKLMQKLIRRKYKKERAFQTIALTQWRVTARHLATTQFARAKLQELAASSFPLAELSSIKTKRPQKSAHEERIRRSSTCYRLETTRGRQYRMSKRG